MTDQNEYAGHSPEWWKRYYKIKGYIPILEEEAHEDEDIEFLELLANWRRVWSEVRSEHKEFVLRRLSGELSFADAKKEHLIKLIDFIIEDTAEKGILITVPEGVDVREALAV